MHLRKENKRKELREKAGLPENARRPGGCPETGEGTKAEPTTNAQEARRAVIQRVTTRSRRRRRWRRCDKGFSILFPSNPHALARRMVAVQDR